MTSAARIRVATVLNTMGIGGVGAVAYELLRRLPADRYEHFVYALRRAGDHADARARQAERFAALGATVRLPQRDAKKVGAMAELCEWFAQDEIDIVHTHSYKPNLYGRIAGTLHAAAPMVAHYHNVYDDKWDADGTLVYERLLARRTARLVACSQAVADHVAERLGIEREQVLVIPNGVDVDRFAASDGGARVREELGVEDGAPLIGLVGRVSRQKAQDDLLRAARLVLDRRPDCAFVLAGGAEEPELLDELHALARSLGIVDRVRFMGHVADMPALYAALDVLVAPSRWEGYGLVLAEAMAAGLPIVASDIGAIREVTADGTAARLVAPDSPAALAAALGSVIEDPQGAAELGARGRVVAQRWSWDRSAVALDALYGEVAAARAGQP
jgi:glycosyltransferase involved in cell wall biosynthesis